MEKPQWHVVTGRFHYDFGVYFNNKYVVNGSSDWCLEEDQDYYVTIRDVDDEAIEVLSFVIKNK